jgi:hypothetical protein
MNEEQILNESIADHEAAIATARQKLADLKKPKIEHGDGGILDDYGLYIAVKCDEDIKAKRGDVLLVSEHGLTPTLANKEVYLKQWTKQCNIFKDFHEKLGRVIATAEKELL